ncbi:hypothetical protein TSOC_000113 [Tetrabaena socialis]|uniref:Uncharacterized protein n=1 Tax=Tetrabaena socialis TaxID=47790 RepID=A0A2J8AK77_9CHLO|nr:hypothetical protein TSOC_000113 [Tetrabaena socialis]|eukprot:PNH12925.1 hypothetical protein TSOC_000113 [Tetrabaena socialis]
MPSTYGPAWARTDDDGPLQRGSELNFTGTADSLLAQVQVLGRVLKGLVRPQIVKALSRYGSRFFGSRFTANAALDECKMSTLIASDNDLRARVSRLMDAGAFAAAMDKCNFQRNVDAHTNSTTRLRQEMKALVDGGMVALMQEEMPVESTNLERHDEFLAILPT